MINQDIFLFWRKFFSKKAYDIAVDNDRYQNWSSRINKIIWEDYPRIQTIIV